MLKNSSPFFKLLLLFPGTLLGIYHLFTSAVFAKPYTIVSPLPAEKSVNKCDDFSPPLNTVWPMDSIANPEQKQEPFLATPTSTCAADLVVPSAPSDTLLSQKFVPPAANPNPSESNDPLSLQIKDDPNRWRFIFQPYVTVPVNTYGSATVKGRTVDYHLGLGSLLRSLKATASARVEAWKGNWGFVVDGYYAGLGSITNIRRETTLTPTPFNTVDYLLSRGINNNLAALANQLDLQIQSFRDVKEAKTAEITAKLDTLTDNVQILKENLQQDLESLQEVAEDIDNLREEWAQKQQKLETLTTKIEYLQALQGSGFELEPDQKIKAAIAINSAIAKNQEQLQDLEAKLENLPNPANLDSLRQNLQKIQQNLQETQQKVAQLRQIKDSDPLGQLQTALAEKQAQVDQTLEQLETIKDSVENREPLQANNDITSNLDFSQGIYDFAVSYNFGDTPPMGLPKEASGQSFPRLWFQPIAGTRLNSLNLTLKNTINYSIPSSLVNVEGTVQNTYQASRLWFEPLLGAKVGIQLAALLVLWLRGDYSGFGLAGDTDYSWNLLFGMDWWVRESISLQLGYRFYEINYQNGRGSDAFGFSESFNGPFLSASFHF